MSRRANAVLRLDNQDATYPAGSTVTGRLSVECFLPGQESVISVYTAWETGGEADVYDGNRTRRVLYEGHWKVGDQRFFNFELPLAPWPVSYRGIHFTIKHRVGYQVRIEGQPVAEGTIPITVLPGAGTAQHLLPQAPQHSGATDHMAGCLTCSGVMLFSGTVVSLMAANAHGDATNLGITAATLIGLGALAGIGGSWTYFAERKLGPVFVGLEPTAHAGGPLRVFVRFTPTTDVTINEIRVTLKGREKSSRSEGDTSSNLYADLLKEELVLVRETRVHEGATWEGEQAFALPADIAPSMKFDGHEVEWNVNVRIDIPSWPDWYHTYEVLITPPDPLGVNVTLKQRPELSLSSHPQLEQICPYCRDGVGHDPQALVTCAGCRTVFHKECLREFGTCSTQGCRSRRQRT